MADHIRWGVLGASNFALKTMARAIHESRRGAFAAIATRDPARAAPFAEFAPGLRVHDSYDALLADPDIDAVYIPLPNAMHVDWSIRAAKAGKAVLCEKPIGMNAADFDRLIAARDQTGKLIAEGYMPVHHPQWHYAKDLLASGAIGALHNVSGVFSFGLPQNANIRNNADLGGGAMRDIGVYPVGTFRYVTGAEPVVDWAHMVMERGVDVSTWVEAHADAVRFSFHLSIRTSKRQEMVFEGTEGWFSLSAPFNAGEYGEAQVRLCREGQAETLYRAPTTRQYVNQVEAFNTSLLDGWDYPCMLEFSKGTQVVLDDVFATAVRVEQA